MSISCFSDHGASCILTAGNSRFNSESERMFTPGGFMAEDVYIGLDLGGTRLRAARFSKELEMQQRSETLTLAEEGPDAVIRRMLAQARAVWPTDGSRVAGIGISAPGPINPFTGVITAPPNLAGWHNVPLREIFHRELG